jgi:hypothetical protein
MQEHNLSLVHGEQRFNTGNTNHGYLQPDNEIATSLASE